MAGIMKLKNLKGDSWVGQLRDEVETEGDEAPVMR
jgi:hypothetical protein